MCMPGEPGCPVSHIYRAGAPKFKRRSIYGSTDAGRPVRSRDKAVTIH